MRSRKTDAIDYNTRYSRKWRSEGRTIALLKGAGFTVVRFARTQRRKHRAYSTDEPNEAGLIASDGKSESKIVIVTAGRKVSESRRESLREFGRRMKPLAIELWTWPALAREPEIERM